MRLLLGLLAALLALPVAAQSPTGTLKKIADTRTINLGFRSDAAPFAFQGSDGQPAGYAVDLCRAVSERLGAALGTPLKVNWVPVNAANRIAKVTAGEIDLECGITTVTFGRQQQVDFSNLIFVDGGAVLLRADDGASKRLSDLTGKTLGVMPNTTTETALRKALAERQVNAKIVLVKDEQDGMAALRDKKIDGFAADRIVLIGLVLRAPVGGAFALTGDDFSFEPYALMMRRGEPDFRLAVNRALADTYRGAALGQIYERWFGAVGAPGPLLVAMYYLNTFSE
jgi:ABC-type amino acid transport substrate-binding protein